MNGNNLTIIQTVKTFELIADGHAQINDFYPGKLENLNASTRSYPILWIDLVDMTPFETHNEFTWRVGVFDVMQQDESNLWEVISDTNLIIKDILLLLRDTYDLQVLWGKGKQMPVFEYQNDFLSGMFYDIVIRTPDDRGLCDIPLNCS